MPWRRWSRARCSRSAPGACGRSVTGILLSAVFTGLIHSSAATIGIGLALAGHGLIPLDGAINIVLGANIGTCSTALMASFRAPSEARRVAWAHVLFKVVGVAIAVAVLPLFTRLVHATGTDLLRQVANAHTLFNVCMAVIFLPFIGLFDRLLTRMVPEVSDEKKFGPKYLDEHVIGTPALALDRLLGDAP